MLVIGGGVKCLSPFMILLFCHISKKMTLRASELIYSEHLSMANATKAIVARAIVTKKENKLLKILLKIISLVSL